MAVRNTYTLRDERLMWEYIFERLQDGDAAAYQPKGLKLWKGFEATQKTNKTASSLATHFRKAMCDYIEEAVIPVEQQLYIVSQLNIKLSRRQQKTIEYKNNISITVDDLGFVTSYRKEGKEYIPSLFKRRMSYEDDNINDEQNYDEFELNGSTPKIAKLSQSFNKNSVLIAGHYNLRKRQNAGNNGLLELHNSEEGVHVVEDNSNRSDNGHGDRCNGDEQDKIFQGNQIGSVETAELQSGMSQFVEVANKKSVTKDNYQFGMNHQNLSCNNVPTSTAVLTVDEELQQLLAYIFNKRQLKGVEKMKTEKILELRAQEAKRLGVSLRRYLRKMNGLE